MQISELIYVHLKFNSKGWASLVRNEEAHLWFSIEAEIVSRKLHYKQYYT